MKKILPVILFSLSFACLAQNNDFLWPIKGQQKGENILYKPQDYIEKELNFDNLIIHAPEGTIVQSPVSGTVVMYSYTYQKSLTYQMSYGLPPVNYKEDSMALVRSGWNSNDDIKYLSAALAIKFENGKTLYISGLRPIKTFKTGEKITQGDEIGTVGYFYKAVKQPSIDISLSEHGKPADPMSPFGLQTTFKKPEQKSKTILSQEEAKSDIMTLVDALKEGFPGLYDYISEEEFDAQISSILASMPPTVKIPDFYKIVRALLRNIRDNHLAVLSYLAPDENAFYMPTVSFGWYGDSLIVTRTTGAQSKYYKQKIKEVDGIPADVLKEKIRPYIDRVEGNVESYGIYILKTLASMRYLGSCPEASPQRDLSLTFENGETVLFPGYKWSSNTCVNLQPMWRAFATINTDSLVLEHLPDQTAYLGIHTFELNEVEVNRIAEFIRSLADSNYRHLIIDVRNNSGGSAVVEEKIFSYIAQQPFKTSIYSQVNKKGKFDFFKNSLNYSPEAEDIFPEYASVQGKGGYYLYNDDEILPDEITNFKGKVYVLINETSLSASANLAALVHKYRRGALVGRETGSAYHQMKALKFADLRLPNSQIDVRIPLVKIVFDTCVNSGIPFGRGVLPDYEQALSLEELSFESGDAILNLTKQLIENGDYLKEIQTTEAPPVWKNLGWYVYLILALCCAIIIYFTIRAAKKRKP